MYSSFFMRKPAWAKKFLLAIALMMPLSSVHAMGLPKESPAVQSKSEALHEQVPATQTPENISVEKKAAQQALMQRMIVALALGDHPELVGCDRSIEKHEFDEFQVAWMVEVLNATVTNYGAWALSKKSIPVNDPEYVERNQKMVKVLVENEALYIRIGSLLKKVKQHESALVSFLNPEDELNKQAQDLYFNFPLINNDALNKNRLTLELAGVLDMGRATLQILGALCLTGVWYEWINALDQPAEVLEEEARAEATGDKKKEPKGFNLIRGIKRGFSGVIDNHNPLTTKITDNYDQRASYYGYAMAHGTFGDRVNASYYGFKVHPHAISKQGTNFFAPSEWGKNMPGVLKTPVQLFAGVSALAAAVLPTLWYDYTLYQSIKGAAAKVKHVFGTMQQLRNTLAECAHGIKAVNDLSRFVQHQSQLKANALMNGMSSVLAAKNNKNLAAALSNLRSATFMGTDIINRFMYSRGKVLQTNKLLRESAKGLIPALQGVGELDAAYAMATMMKRCQDKPNKFSFVEFVDSANPLIELHNAWIPVFGIDDAVMNDVRIGGNRSTKLMLTGPNGGGKSAYLKNSIGQSLILAHSWGIAPAESARMSFFSGIASCVAAKEDMKKGISTFMAEKAGMDRLSRFMTNAATKPGHYMVFADEPFRGTVNDETAYRTGLFCKELVAKPNVAGVIATHIMPIITPQEKAQFSFAHVEIVPNRDGGFMRTYKLKDGICNWWFNDQSLRRAYIDWLADQKKIE